MEFRDVVRSRRMTRAFLSTPIPREEILSFIDLASRAPSAGKSQGWHFVVLDGADVERFWSISLPIDRRADFAWPHLLDAPCIILPCAHSSAYVSRYAEPDKERTGLGSSSDVWPVPYWTVDASFATMSLLLAVEDAGLGALFFGLFNGEEALRREFGIPEGVDLLGAIAIGHRRPGSPRPGLSASRPRHSVEDISSFGGWKRKS